MKKPLLLLALSGFVTGPSFAVAAEDVQPLRDPTRPPAWQAEPQSAQAPGGPRLEAIRRGGGRALATIDGTAVKIGDDVQGMRLVRIGESFVILEGDAGRKTLQLTPAATKTLRHAPSGKEKK
jgi:MSHA biogenesis protein MshK